MVTCTDTESPVRCVTGKEEGKTEGRKERGKSKQSIASSAMMDSGLGARAECCFISSGLWRRVSSQRTIIPVNKCISSTFLHSPAPESQLITGDGFIADRQASLVTP